MKPIVFLSIFWVSIMFAGEDVMSLNLMPMPKSVELTEGEFVLDDTLTIGVSGVEDMRIHDGATRVLHRLKNRTGLFLPQQVIVPDKPVENPDMIISIDRVESVTLDMDEAYNLNITPETIELTAETDIGALRGMETFMQLLSVKDGNYVFPALDINDEPRFAWRGLLIDVCRHWQPVAVIKRNLDAMAAVKMNVLHWHLTEDQGFRVECKTFPKLHLEGSDGLYYTHNQIKDIIEYAAERGIRVVPEFDIPGHSTSWFVGYLEFASLPGPYEIERQWGIMDPTFDPTLEATYTFFDKFFKEMTALFPDEYVHIGGDENNGKQWDANPDIQEFMQQIGIKDNHALQAYFNQRILDILTRYDKKMMGWEEILQPEMPTSIMIQSWRGRESLVEAAKKGYQTILSNGYYIDLMKPAFQHYLNDPCPPDIDLTEAQKEFIIGGEATMWGEFVTEENIDSRIWPRTAAIAERFWSPYEVRDVDNMYARLETISFRLEELGVQHLKNYGMMLRRLTNNQDTAPLKTLVEVVEPLKIYQRNQKRTFKQYSPYTRVMDAARPDARVARNFNTDAKAWITNPDDAELTARLRATLTQWREHHAKLAPIMKNSPILREIQNLSFLLSECGQIGLTCMSAVQNGETLANERVRDFEQRLEQAKESQAQVELMMAPGIETLLNATRAN